MTTFLRRFPSLAILALAGSFIACNQIFQIVPGVEGTGGNGGTSPATSSGSTASTSSTGSTTSTGSAASTSSTGSTTSTSATGSSSSTSTTGSSSSTSAAGSSSSTGSGGPLDGGVSLQSCVLLLHMDEPSWTGAAGEVKDSSGQGNNGTAQGTTSTTAGGKFGRAGKFDGSGWVTVPNAASLEPTTALTYAAWIYPTGLPEPPNSDPNTAPAPGILSKRLMANNQVDFTLFLWTSNTAWVDIEGLRFASKAVFANNTWYHLAVVYDGSVPAVTLYVNGKPESPQTPVASLSPNTNDVVVGNLPNGGNPFVGLIDEVAIWNRALSAAEVQNLYGATQEL